MPNTLQNFLVNATQKTADDLVSALNNLAADKRAWKPAAAARSALDMVAECALNNGYVADLIATNQWTAGGFEAYARHKADLVAGDEDVLRALLKSNTERLTSVLSAVPDDTLTDDLETPYGTFTVAHTIAYPYWNMSYHLGQINYIASILESPE